MGWTFYQKPHGVSAVESIKKELGAAWVAKHVVAMTATWNAVFAVVERDDIGTDVYVPDADGKTRGLAVFMIRNNPRACDGYNFGYKDMTETMGPVGCEAPLSILAKCSPLQPLMPDTPDGSLRWAHNYRDRCKRMAEAKAIKRSLKAGSVVTLAAPLNFGGQMIQTFTVERCRVRGRKAAQTTVFRAPNGMLCNISPRDLVGATVVMP